MELTRPGHGDCGSWVVDNETGDLYGHIVAGSPESSVAFIIPALAIRSEMKERFGSDWILPQNNDSSKVQDDIPPTKVAQMIMPGSHESHDERDRELTGSKVKQSSDLKYDSIGRDTKSQFDYERCVPSLPQFDPREGGNRLLTDTDCLRKKEGRHTKKSSDASLVVRLGLRPALLSQTLSRIHLAEPQIKARRPVYCSQANSQQYSQPGNRPLVFFLGLVLDRVNYKTYQSLHIRRI